MVGASLHSKYYTRNFSSEDASTLNGRSGLVPSDGKRTTSTHAVLAQVSEGPATASIPQPVGKLLGPTAAADAPAVRANRRAASTRCAIL